MGTARRFTFFLIMCLLSILDLFMSNYLTMHGSFLLLKRQIFFLTRQYYIYTNLYLFLYLLIIKMSYI